MSAKSSSAVLSKPTGSFAVAPLNLLQRKCACGESSALSGECTECSRKKLSGDNQPLIQPKLKISQPNDKYEREADHVANMVMRMPEPTIQPQVNPEEEEEETVQTKLIGHRNIPFLQREVENEEEEDNILQTKGESGHIPQVPSVVTKGINGLKGNGQPLSEATRDFFEPRFGHDFSQVRVHTGTQAGTVAQGINARAFTVGQNVVFGKGQYAPETLSGKHLLAHELTHVVQQGKSRVPSSIQGKAIGVKHVNGGAIQLKEKQPYKAIILSPDEILADSDPQRAAAYQQTGMPPVRFCQEPKAPRDKKNCPIPLIPGTPVKVIGGNESTWVHIEHPPIPELGGQKFGWVIGAFIKESSQTKAKQSVTESGSSSPPEAQEISEPKVGSVGKGRKLKKQTGFSLPIGFATFSPLNLVGNGWLLLPDSWKPRLVDKAIDANLTLVDLFPGKFALGNLWIFMKAGLIGFFKKLKSASQTTKIQVTNRIAKIMAGQSLAYSLGLLKGLLKGFFIDGLLGIFIAIGEIIKGLKHLWSFFEKVGQLIGGFPDEITKLIQGFRSFGQEVVKNLKPALEELRKVILDPGQGKKLVSIIVEKGKSHAKKAGQDIADELLTFFSKPGSEKKTGEVLGRITGMVIFEAIFAILTVGGGLAVKAVKTGAKTFARIAGKIFGSVLKVFKQIHVLFGHVSNVIKQAATFVKGKVLSNLTGKLHDLLKQVQKLIIRFLKNCHESKLVCNFAKAIVKAHEVVWKGFTKGKRADHFVKHGAEFAAKNGAQYERFAKEFAKKTGPGIREHKVVNTFFKYEEATNTLFIGNGSGRHIKTFYKPLNGLAGFFEAIQEHIDTVRKLRK